MGDSWMTSDDKCGFNNAINLPPSHLTVGSTVRMKGSLMRLCLTLNPRNRLYKWWLMGDEWMTNDDECGENIAATHDWEW